MQQHKSTHQPHQLDQHPQNRKEDSRQRHLPGDENLVVLQLPQHQGNKATRLPQIQLNSMELSQSTTMRPQSMTTTPQVHVHQSGGQVLKSTRTQSPRSRQQPVTEKDKDTPTKPQYSH